MCNPIGDCFNDVRDLPNIFLKTLFWIQVFDGKILMKTGWYDFRRCTIMEDRFPVLFTQ